MMTEAELGRQHAAAYIMHPKTFDTIGPRSYAYADAALDELERQQRTHSELLDILLDGGNHGARQLNVDPVQGLREIVQNADDLGAGEVRFGTRTVDGRRQVLIVHDGAPVDLPHVLPMVYPFMSTKRGQASLKGSFGVGLKTLSRLGGGLTIHSAPFHFASRDNLAVREPPVPAIPGFYDPVLSETLFTLFLGEEIADDFLDHWFATWSPSDLLFLDEVRRVTLHDLDHGTIISKVEITVLPDQSHFDLSADGGRARTEERTFEIGGRFWKRFVVRVAVPADKMRDGKATGSTTPVGIAFPLDGQANGKLHVALPTRISTGACFSIDGQFDPATSREELVNDGWNRWLTGVAAELSGSLAIHLAHRRSPLLWLAIPVGAQSNSASKWLNDRLAHGWAKAVDSFVKDPHLIGGADGGALWDLSYCDADTEGLLEPDDHLAVAGARMVPADVCDDNGRWREVLDTTSVSRRISLRDIVACCADGRFDPKLPQWFLSLAARCVDLESEELLVDGRWVPLANGGRTWARQRSDATELLTLEAPRASFAARHDLIVILHPVFHQSENRHVLDWMAVAANLVVEVSATDILQAFAAKHRDAPLEAMRDDLRQIRDLFAEVPEREPTELGLAVGRAVTVEAHRYKVDAQGRRNQVAVRALPSEVYLPSTIEEQKDGWSQAASDTPDLTWAISTYGEVFKIPGRAAKGRNSRSRAAKRFLLLLGAMTTPPVRDGSDSCQLQAPRSSGACVARYGPRGRQPRGRPHSTRPGEGRS